jgi:hypothetical protein
MSETGPKAQTSLLFLSFWDIGSGHSEKQGQVPREDTLSGHRVALPHFMCFNVIVYTQITMVIVCIYENNVVYTCVCLCCVHMHGLYVYIIPCVFTYVVYMLVSELSLCLSMCVVCVCVCGCVCVCVYLCSLWELCIWALSMHVSLHEVYVYSLKCVCIHVCVCLMCVSVASCVCMSELCVCVITKLCIYLYVF